MIILRLKPVLYEFIKYLRKMIEFKYRTGSKITENNINNNNINYFYIELLSLKRTVIRPS